MFGAHRTATKRTKPFAGEQHRLPPFSSIVSLYPPLSSASLSPSPPMPMASTGGGDNSQKQVQHFRQLINKIMGYGRFRRPAPFGTCWSPSSRLSSPWSSLPHFSFFCRCNLCLGNKTCWFTAQYSTCFFFDLAARKHVDGYDS